MGLLLFPSFFCELICYIISPNAGVCWYPLKNNTGSLSEGADVSVSFFCVVSGSPDMGACRAESDPKKAVFKIRSVKRIW